MTNIDFEIEDPTRKWRREADEREAELDAEREKDGTRARACSAQGAERSAGRLG